MSTPKSYEVPSEVIRDIYRAIRLSPPGGRWQFLWNPRGDYSPAGSFGFTFYVDHRLLRRAALTVIRQAHSLLAGRSVGDVSSLLQSFVRSSLASLDAGAIFFSHGNDKTLDSFVSPSMLEGLTADFTQHLLGSVEKALYIVPIWRIPCPSEVISDRVFWVPGNYNLRSILDQFGDFQHVALSGARFPPFDGWKGVYIPLGLDDSWMGCLAVCETEADSLIQRQVAALSIILDFPQSRLFSGAVLQRGRVSIAPSKGWTFYDKPPVTPPLLNKPEPTFAMANVFRGLVADKAEDQRLQVALEYIAAGWQPVGRLGFLHNAIALDALLGIQGRVKMSILEGLERHAGGIKDVRARAELLYQIRNRLLHGECESVEMCPEYLEYYDSFEVDPANDQIQILRETLWHFSGA